MEEIAFLDMHAQVKGGKRERSSSSEARNIKF